MENDQDILTKTEKMIWLDALDVCPNLRRISSECGIDYSRVKRIYKHGGMKVSEMEKFFEFIRENKRDYDF